ncbi:hypothetical protein [Streptomyces longwoodensis]|uniref:hypothetical protein n=1 Tax=Streptomyces longwoodensis TaxID=68231 RepID=UPI0037F3B232
MTAADWVRLALLIVCDVAAIWFAVSAWRSARKARANLARARRNACRDAWGSVAVSELAAMKIRNLQQRSTRS